LSLFLVNPNLFTLGGEYGEAMDGSTVLSDYSICRLWVGQRRACSCNPAGELAWLLDPTQRCSDVPTIPWALARWLQFLEPAGKQHCWAPTC